MRNFHDRWYDSESSIPAAFGAWRPLLAQLDSLMNDAFFNVPAQSRALAPALDLSESEDSYFLSFDMPGVEKDKIDVEVQGNRLVVSAERRRKQHSGEDSMSLRRAVTIPDGINPSEIEAQYQDGVLSIALPKAPEAKKQKIKLGETKGGFLNKLLKGTVVKKDRDQIKIAEESTKKVS